jgi:tetratricopeptide (TPR) repeat protein
MKLDNEYDRFDAIERFCKGVLTSSENEMFINALHDDSTLLQEVNEYKNLLEVMRKANLENQIKTTLARLEAEEPITTLANEGNINTMSQRKGIIIKYIGALAAACVIFILYVSLATVQLPGTENDLNVVRDIDPTVLNPIQKSAYDHFYTGQLHIADGQFEAAVLDFKEVLNTPNLRKYFAEATQWHLVIAYFKSGNIKEAEKLYDTLTSCSDCVYHVSMLNRSKIWWQIFWAKVF